MTSSTIGAISSAFLRLARATDCATDGSGLVLYSGGGVRGIETAYPGQPQLGVENWHGAGIHGAMTHVAIVWSKDGSIVDWKEAVSDAEHGAAPQPR